MRLTYNLPTFKVSIMAQHPSVITEIQNDKSIATQRRRQIAALSAAGLVDFSLISLLQMGYFKKLPDLPGKLFDTQKVNSAKDAVLLGMPDGVLSLAGYTAAVLVAVAGMRFKKKAGLIDLVLAGIVIGQAAGAAKYLVNMATVQKKVCVYCVAGAAINFAALAPLYKLLKTKV
jgi:uncharacterized membrane protein